MGHQFLITASTKDKLVIFILGILGASLVILSTNRFGAGLSVDSVGYIGTARNLLTEASVTSYDGSPLVVHAPLFPIVLALTSALFKTDPLAMANIVNAFIFGLTVYFGGLLILKYFSPFPRIALLGTAAILASIPLVKVAVMAWSEPLFILLVVLSLLFANSYREKGDILSLILLSLSVAFAALTRYIGIAQIVWGASILIISYQRSLKDRIIHLLLFVLIAAIPVGLWLARNYVISNTLFGPRGPSSYSLSQNLLFVSDVLMTWYVPSIIADHRVSLILFGGTIGFLAELHPADSWQIIKFRLRPAAPAVWFILIYVTFLVVSSTTTSYDKIDNRLLSPIYLPLTVLAMFFAQAVVEPSLGQFSNKAIRSLPVIAFAIWLLVYPLRMTIINIRSFAPVGQGYNSKAWIESRTVHYLIEHPHLESECTLYSNDPYAVYILANIRAKMSPAKTFHNTLESENGWLGNNDIVCLIWFDKGLQGGLFSIEELQTDANMSLIVRFDDGAIYSVTKK